MHRHRPRDRSARTASAASVPSVEVAVAVAAVADAAAVVAARASSEQPVAARRVNSRTAVPRVVAAHRRAPKGRSVTASRLPRENPMRPASRVSRGPRVSLANHGNPVSLASRARNPSASRVAISHPSVARNRVRRRARNRGPSLVNRHPRPRTSNRRRRRTVVASASLTWCGRPRHPRTNRTAAASNRNGARRSGGAHLLSQMFH